MLLFATLTSLGAPVHWEVPVIELTVDQAVLDRVSLGALVSATEAWRGIQNVPPIVITGTTTGLGISRSRRIMLDYDLPDDGSTLMVATENFGDDGIVRTGYVRVNPWVRWDETGDPDSHDVESAMAHEFGHLLGLSHSYDRPSIMYPWLASGELKRAPMPEDEAELVDSYAPAAAARAKRSVYNPSHNIIPGTAGCQVGNPGRSNRSGLVAVILVLWFCLEMSRRSR